MSLKAYSEINLHIVWHVKGGIAVLRDDIEMQVHRYLRGQVVQNSGAFFHEIGGVDDHVHLVVTIPPTLLISEWIGRLKGSSSHFINHHVANRKVLEWQSKYGVVSFGTKDLPWIIDYVRNQREHHTCGTVQERLERAETEDEGKPAQAG
ncbi:MAG: IS200/IS605 family transposase [Phycisphaerae bacterium]|nr:IS200/IS605 family transposase [Phycisphaerae bacterium]